MPLRYTSVQRSNRLFRANKITLWKWPGNNLDLNPIETFGLFLKDNVAEKRPPNISAPHPYLNLKQLN